MSRETPQQELFNSPEDWFLVQEAIGVALRHSVEQVTVEPLPGAVALLLVRLAFAEVVEESARSEISALGVVGEPAEAHD